MNYNEAIKEILSTYGINILKNNFEIRSLLSDRVRNSIADRELIDKLYELNRNSVIYDSIIKNKLLDLDYVGPKEKLTLQPIYDFFGKSTLLVSNSVDLMHKKATDFNRIILDIRCKNLGVFFYEGDTVNIFKKNKDVTSSIETKLDYSTITYKIIDDRGSYRVQLPIKIYKAIKIFYLGKMLHVFSRENTNLKIDSLPISAFCPHTLVHVDARDVSIKQISGKLFYIGKVKELNIKKNNMWFNMSNETKRYRQELYVDFGLWNIETSILPHIRNHLKHKKFKRLNSIDGFYTINKHRIKIDAYTKYGRIHF